ncbi:transforming growth factor beta regulator 1-like isoform X1 [Zootermopsis nevadensis]|uniref:transforming growth factor beta regulator 1-like isoform X1 n=1 Tax=Zootermopsis nevadensis TaxID=136037 RepID=UPI000B8E5774|nr:transforming growth factor beta regulator 1-like isoform X1 [Zootermopsis nevadensis]
MAYMFSDGYGYLQNSAGGLVSAVNRKYKKKYKKTKRTINDLVFENAALCDQVSLVQKKILIVKEEKRFLLKKLYNLQAIAETDNQLQIHTPKLPTAGLSSPSATSDTSSSAKKSSAKKRCMPETPESHKINPKLKKGSTAKAKKIVQPIPLDITGRPVFPIALGGLTVHSLGEVRTRFYFESSYNKHTA